jgi:hypothetical protein
MEEIAVLNQENSYLSNISNMQGNAAYMMPMEANTAAKSLVEETKKHRAMYPEIHYKMEPFISTTCDMIESSGVMPTQEEMENITDNIYDEFCKMYPEMENYMKPNQRDNDPPEAVTTQFMMDDFRRGDFGQGDFGRFRRRGIGRDFILALLLSRLFGRRRGFNPFFTSF